MNFINARPAEGNIRLSYQREGRPASEPFEYDMRRMVIGLSYPQHATTSATSYGYCVVVGERVFYHPEGSRPPSRMYIVLDEADANDQEELYRKIVALKDMYLCATVFCPDRPAPQVEALNAYEGIAYYSQEDPLFLRQRWPTYVSRKTTASTYTLDIPPIEQQAAELQRLLSTEVLHPETLWPMFGRGASVVYRLMVPANMFVDKVRTAIPMPLAFPQVVQALYMAVHGMETTVVWHKQQETHRHQGSPVTGY